MRNILPAHKTQKPPQKNLTGALSYRGLCKKSNVENLLRDLQPSRLAQP